MDRRAEYRARGNIQEHAQYGEIYKRYRVHIREHVRVHKQVYFSTLLYRTITPIPITNLKTAPSVAHLGGTNFIVGLSKVICREIVISHGGVNVPFLAKTPRSAATVTHHHSKWSSPPVSSVYQPRRAVAIDRYPLVIDDDVVCPGVSMPLHKSFRLTVSICRYSSQFQG